MTDVIQQPGETGPQKKKRVQLTQEEIEALPEATELLGKTREFLKQRRSVRIIERRHGCCRQRILTIEVDAGSQIQDGDLWYSDVHSFTPSSADAWAEALERNPTRKLPITDAYGNRIPIEQVQTRGLSLEEVAIIARAGADKRDDGLRDGWTTYKIKGERQPPSPSLPPL